MPLTIQDLITKVRAYYPTQAADASASEGDSLANIDMIQDAYDLAAKAHEGQFRQAGEPYIVHPLAVAFLLADLRLDVASICAGLLHDCIEDTSVTAEAIAKQFGTEVAFLVEGVTKLGQMLWQSRQEQQAENFRKMLLAMARDIRVVLIKLCDRLDNMRSLHALPDHKQKRIAKETLDIYSPLAHRLGIQWIKTQLDDLAFKALYPKEYKLLEEKLQHHFSDRPSYIQEVEQVLTQLLHKNGIEAQVKGRPKHLWSIYQKTVKTGYDLDQLYDIIAFRAVVGSVRDCYGALGVIHGTWTPIPGRFKDFIALPKSNRYQSLHTTVIGPHGERIEIQLRTAEMHRVAEEGIAAHWKYKEGQPSSLQNGDEKTFAWLHQLMEWQKTLADPTEFIETVKVDLFADEVFVFTPQGDVKVLPQGATPVDFAYLVHTEVGHHCVGARINGLMVPLRYQLKNGDTVQILTNPNHHPNKDWLKFVVSSGAKSKIRSALRTDQRQQSKELGKNLLDKELRKQGSSYKDQEKTDALSLVAQAFKCASVEELLIHIGYGKRLSGEVVRKLLPDAQPVPSVAAEPNSTTTSQIRPPTVSSAGIKVAGENNILVRFGKCCTPLPGDPILGIITRGRGVTVHLKTCPTGLEQDDARRIETEWDEHVRLPRPVSVQLNCADRPGLLAQISQAFHQHGIDISQAHCRTAEDNRAINTFTCRVKDVEHLQQLIRSLQQIPSVDSVERI